MPVLRVVPNLYILCSLFWEQRRTRMFDSEIRLLELCSNKDFGVREILNTLRGSHTSNMRLIKELERSGVLELIRSLNGRGRPKKIVALSPLGAVVLDKLRSVNAMMLKMNENDIRNVDKQLRLWHKLIDAGVDPYKRFIEMNEFDRNIRNFAESGTST